MDTNEASILLVISTQLFMVGLELVVYQFFSYAELK